MNLEIICTQVCKIAKKAGSFIKEEKEKFDRSKIEIKGFNDFVSYVDKTSERIIVQELINIIPEAGFITEENTIQKKAENYNWIIDPLDGTTNFIHGVPCFCISIALAEKNEIILGVVLEINQNECFYSWKGAPAFLNNHQINTSKASFLKDSLLATGFPYYDYTRIDNYLNLFKYFMQNTRGVRRLGSAAADLAYVACGRFDGFYEYSLKPWDVAAGAFIVKQAGGKICDYKGGNNWLFGQEIIASNNKMYDEFLEAVKKFF